MISEFRKSNKFLEGSQTLPVFLMLTAALKMTMRWAIGGILLEEKTEIPVGKQ